MVSFAAADTMITIMTHNFKTQVSAIASGSGMKARQVFRFFVTPFQRCLGSTFSASVSLSPLALIQLVLNCTRNFIEMVYACLTEFSFIERRMLAAAGTQSSSSEVIVTLFFVFSIGHIAISHV